ncbi:uncharacterized protein BX663DRAFT_514303 [Cokeromyces recurvatus]|uniref:uncharacterized protein n=1 Tax=Cokeromyces recurvatus TaxID=90255 RepID=UPI00221F819C|nr:uncharacterized protein BX663DRAFT_514303 [Cokeromyces recurvatus]KAI7901391.1 hypothetical protein BX663DRAFT_514303 [Cokeromyces recurvatus]
MTKKTNSRNNNVNELNKDETNHTLPVLEKAAPIPTSNPNDVLENDVEVPDHSVVQPSEANKKPDEFSFFKRLMSLPLIRDGSSMVQYYANKNTLSRYALDRLESSFTYAVTMVSPYTEKYKTQLLKVDHLGCQSLDLVQNKLPIVTQTSTEILTTVKESPHKVYTEIKDGISHAASIPVTRTTHCLQTLIDYYLPPINKDENNKVEGDAATKKGKKGKKEEEDHDDERNVSLTLLANEVKDRLLSRFNYIAAA